MIKGKMRVLMIVQSIYLNDPRVRREAELLAREGCRVDVVSLRNEQEPFLRIVNNVRIYGIKLGRRYGSKFRYLYEYAAFQVLAAFLTVRLTLVHRYDLVQIHNLPDTLIFCALFPKLLGAKAVFDAHEAMPESLRIKYGLSEESRTTRCLKILERFCMSLADHVLTIHEPIRQLFISRGIPAGKISVVMNLPDPGLFRPLCDKPAERPLRTEFALIYAGTIAERYGLQTAIKALPLLRADIPGIRFQVYGKGDFQAPLERLAVELDVRDRVFFKSPVPHSDMAAVYGSADIGISPHENDLFGDIYFSTKVAEYMACGLPVIVSRTRVMNHYYTDSQVAFFSPGDYNDFAKRVFDIYLNPVYRRQLIQNGLKLCEEWSWAQEGRNYIDALGKFGRRRLLS
ncbi:MAG: glycosyltransferase family 4 protein [Candidatus Aminicenantes bacterium]|nr:glycosyltransferase family 4 protein [Candidatus Aminicenantes bacterium]